MDRNQAEQIMGNHNNVEVQYQDVPVWIKNVEGSTAEVEVIGTNRKLTVPLDELEDTGRRIREENIYGLH